MAASKALRPRKQPIQERSRLTVEAVLDAAVQVFEQYGYAAGTTARIAERAGISVGSLYQYFPNKDAILVALAVRHLDELRGLSTRLIDRGAAILPLKAFVRSLVDGFVELHLRSPQVHRLLAEEVQLPPETRQAFDAFAEELAGRLTAVLGEHEDLRGADHATLAYFSLQVLERLSHALVLHPPPHCSQAAYVEQVVCLVTGYMREHLAAAA